MIYSNTELTELVCTRLSHDLTGSVGAVLGGLELIDDNSGKLDDDIKNILYCGAATLKARQKFFRTAFGSDTKKTDSAELKELCEDYLATTGSRSAPVSLSLENISPALGKITCLCVMTAAEVCIKGGEIRVVAGKDNMLTVLHSDYKLAAGKIDAYQRILSGEKISENVSQYAQLIYLKEFLGKNVPLKISESENSFELLIG